MAEVIGLAVGFVGLAGLFSTCVDCFKLVQVYDSRTRDYRILQDALDNQQFHFMVWGMACGFMDQERPNTRFDDPMSAARNRRIESTLECVQSLLTNGDDLKKKYGLKVHRAPAGAKMIEGPPPSAFSKVFQTTKDFWNTSLQRKDQMSGSVRWVVHDKERFEQLVQNLRDFLEDLAKFTSDMGVTESQRLIVKYELEMIDDETSLKAIAEASACDDGDDLVSHAASRRLSKVRAQSVANQSVAFDDSVSMASQRQYAPSISTLVEEDDEGVAQELGVTRVPLSQWRKVKTRAGIVPWLKVLIVGTGPPASSSSELEDNIKTLSRTDTLDADWEPTSTDRPIRLAINSRTLLDVLRKVIGYRFSPKRNVLVHPFKPLLVFDTELSRFLMDTQRMLAKLKSLRDTAPDDGDAAHLLRPDGAQHDGDQTLSSRIEKAERIIQELECLFAFINDDMQELFNIRRQIREQSLQKITFENLWLLFQPGIVVSSSDTISDNESSGFRIMHVTGGRQIIDQDNYSKSEVVDNTELPDQDTQDGYAMMSSRECTDFVIDCFYMDFDGIAYGPRPQKFSIAEFSGERDIISLPVFPASKDVVGNLVERGMRYRDGVQKSLFLYAGPTLTEWDIGHSNICAFCARNPTYEQLQGQVIIDHNAAIEQCRSSGCNWTPSFGGGVIAKPSIANKREVFETVDCSIPNCRTCTDVFDDAVVDLHLRDKFVRSSRRLKSLQKHELEDEDLVLLTHRLCGYSLNNRRWYPLTVTSLLPFEQPSRGLDDLVIPQRNKDMLSALVEMQSRDSQLVPRDRGSDLILGKGQGTLILLHGAPGTGKTFTAEVIAARLHRPLFAIRMADLGSTSRELEENLTKFMKLAQRWNCILLLNDADVVVAARTRTDREGSNITTVFLDTLEYFTGILVLTTNRVGAFDESLRSRIHLALRYPPLDRKATQKLWEGSLRNLMQEQDFYVNASAKEYIRSRAIRDKPQWNGREIRNVISTAAALARTERVRDHEGRIGLTDDHLRLVVETSKQFDSYLTNVHGTDNDNDNDFSDFRPASKINLRTDKLRYEVPQPSTDDSNADGSGDEIELQVQELETQLQIAKLKHRQKQLRTQRASKGKKAVKTRQVESSDTD
ncbi:hypothetical protein K491DRAFT_657139 [Lophiostoma macrostomum CBS 122681]|uniref:AAA+ ATPase domain-containing protein n=1 Tax=Lophiostoma macrostomum CBS 122681 TaxID=1314788 RepID=A0A6A6T8J6_9PLEO|nr:hypothetical protein K491DRAFT_657139 [Lophiostoma macrostomum CBS 122681]